MLQVRHMHRHGELLRWMALLAAALLALALIGRVAGGATPAEPGEPQPLPAEMDQASRPLSVVPGPMSEPPPPGRFEDRTLQLWQILEHHRAGELDEAIDGWKVVKLPYETDIWKYVGLAAAYLEIGDWEAAELALDVADKYEPGCAVVHYYTALLRLEQATRAYEWQDAFGPAGTRLAAYVPEKVTPNTKSMYKLHAMMELDKAIEAAPRVQLETPLVPEHWTGSGLYSPRVGDLLEALGADQYVGNAHNVLAELCLERGQLELAENNLDAAAAQGVHIVYGYHDLGKAFEDQDRNLDAARAYAKAMKQGNGLALPAKKFFENLRNGILHGR